MVTLVPFLAPRNDSAEPFSTPLPASLAPSTLVFDVYLTVSSVPSAVLTTTVLLALSTDLTTPESAWTTSLAAASSESSNTSTIRNSRMQSTFHVYPASRTTLPLRPPALAGLNERRCGCCWLYCSQPNGNQADIRRLCLCAC